MKTVYFICTGNTCRSPMAEGLFRLYLHNMHMDFIRVKSAGLAARCGDPPTENAVKA
ncbi:MAG: low molecular weight phosphatase family protein, partial [Candidatus Fimenecus sp.]